MTVSYFISQQVDQGWRISPDVFLPRLRQHWPGVEVRDVFDLDRRYSHEWFIVFPSGHIEGMLSKKQMGVVLDGPLDAVAEFAIWFEAEFSPADRSLILYDEGFARVVPLAGQTLGEKIIAAFA